MLDFHSKETIAKVLSKFTEWFYKFTEDLSISLLLYKIEVGSKLDEKRVMIYLRFKLVEKSILSNLEGKRFLKFLFWFWSFKFCTASQILSSVKY